MTTRRTRKWRDGRGARHAEPRSSGGRKPRAGGLRKRALPASRNSRPRRSKAVAGIKRGDRRRAARSSPLATAGELRKWFPALARRGGGGLGTLLVVVEGTGRGWDVAVELTDKTIVRRDSAGVGPEQAVVQAARAMAKPRIRARLATVVGALASVHRLAILEKLLEGAATYRTLQKTTGLKAGPLYHHLTNLRLASLIGPKQRDVYELTRAGRNVLLASILLVPLAADKRRRPHPVA